MSLTLDGVNGISATGNIISSQGFISATGNIYAGNIIATIASSTVSVIGNITGGNIIATNNMLATGNILATGVISSTGAATHASLTLDAPLSVTNGGTSTTTLAANNVLLGNGTSALLSVAPGTSGNLLVSNGTTWTSAADKAIGVGQTWQNLGGSRAVGATYTNTSGRPIQVIITLVNTAGAWFYINGNLVIRQFYDVNTGAGQVGYSFVTGIIPDGSTYLVTNGNLYTWYELR